VLGNAGCRQEGRPCRGAPLDNTFRNHQYGRHPATHDKWHDKGQARSVCEGRVQSTSPRPVPIALFSQHRFHSSVLPNDVGPLTFPEIHVPHMSILAKFRVFRLVSGKWCAPGAGAQYDERRATHRFCKEFLNCFSRDPGLVRSIETYVFAIFHLRDFQV
jgi:hypothetical protein